MNPTAFERVEGIKGKKWKTNIKIQDKTLGQWLLEQQKYIQDSNGIFLTTDDSLSSSTI